MNLKDSQSKILIFFVRIRFGSKATFFSKKKSNQHKYKEYESNSKA
jgi:hypothetical protein